MFIIIITIDVYIIVNITHPWLKLRCETSRLLLNRIFIEDFNKSKHLKKKIESSIVVFSCLQ